MLLIVSSFLSSKVMLYNFYLVSSIFWSQCFFLMVLYILIKSYSSGCIPEYSISCLSWFSLSSSRFGDSFKGESLCRVSSSELLKTPYLGFSGISCFTYNTFFLWGYLISRSNSALLDSRFTYFDSEAKISSFIYFSCSINSLLTVELSKACFTTFLLTGSSAIPNISSITALSSCFTF